MEARLALIAAGWTLLSTGCAKSEQECLALRGAAFELINAPHTCNDDTGCMYSQWPGCAKPVSRKNQDQIDAIKKQFDEGSCQDDENTCREPPDVYCKQGLCVFREVAGGDQNPATP
jgi:hypothetical protein